MAQALSQKNDIYLSNLTEVRQLHAANLQIALELASGVTTASSGTRPEARTTGNTEIHLEGDCDVGGSPTENMTLATLPAGFHSDKTRYFAVVKSDSAGSTRTVVPVRLNETTLQALGTPTADDVYHLGSIQYIAKQLD